MRLPRVRLTVRTMMVAVASVTVALGLVLEGTRMTQRFRYCHEMARRHAACRLGAIHQG